MRHMYLRAMLGGMVCLMGLGWPAQGDTQMGHVTADGFETAPQICEKSHQIDGNPCRMLIVGVQLRHDGSNQDYCTVDWVKWNVGGYEQDVSYLMDHRYTTGWTNIYMFGLVNPTPGSGTVRVGLRRAGTYVVGLTAMDFWNARQSLPAVRKTSFTYGDWEIIGEGSDPWIRGMSSGALLAYFVSARSTAGTWRANEPWKNDYIETELSEWTIRNFVRYSCGYAYISGTDWPFVIRYDSGGSDKLLVAAGIDPVVTPTITLNAPNPMTVQCHSAYVEPGYSATDGWGNDITNYCVNVSSNVNVNVPGDYQVTYHVPCGNGATAVRTVYVRDTAAPTVTITNPTSKTMWLQCKEYSVTAINAVQVSLYDACDGSVTGKTPTIDYGGLNPAAPAVGTYNVTYSVQDAAGYWGSDTLTVTVGDNLKPVIAVNPAEVHLECGTYDMAMALQGVTCADSCDGPLAMNSTHLSGNIPPFSTPGVYTIYYNRHDNSGNAADQKSRTVTIQDTTPPSITVNPAAETFQCLPYTEAMARTGVTATDNCGLASAVVVSGATFPITVEGTYTIYYDVADTAGNPAPRQQRVVTIKDTQPPVITDTGDTAPVRQCPSIYTLNEAAAHVNAVDNCGGDLSGQLEIRAYTDPGGEETPFPVSGVGTYRIRYNVADASGNAAAEKARTLTITDTVKPVWTLPDDLVVRNDEVPITEEQVLEGVSADDACAGVLPVTVTAENLGYGSVNFPIEDPGVPYPRIFRLTYAADDGHGNISTARRSIFMFFEFNLGITLIGNTQVTLQCGESYTAEEDEGALAFDQWGNNVTSAMETAGLPVDTYMLGSHTVTYNVTINDVYYEVMREIIVEDTEAPVITLNRGGFLRVGIGTVYRDPGAVAMDGCEGNVSASIEISGDTVDTSAAPGTLYTVRYDAVDSAGNAATQQVRTVELVLDNTPPEITLLGGAEIQVSCGEGYNEPGFTALDDVSGDRTEAVVLSGDVPDAFSPPGVYTVRYNVTDEVGNPALEQIRTVEVLDDCPLDVRYVGVVDAPGVLHKTMVAGQSYTFVVLVTGAIGPFEHHWLRETGGKAFEPVPNAPNAPVFTLSNLSVEEDTGSYKCVVNDAVTVAESPALTFTVEHGLPTVNAALLAACAAVLASLGALRLRRSSHINK